ncbi:hypothetical protein [Curtobacterium sp. 24E2]|nr:hypothetical protein JN350_04445 [Curtobacterium sp. 24E2]
MDVDVTIVATLEASVSDRAEALRAHITSVLGAHAPFRIRSVVVRVADVVVGGTP